MEREDEEVSCFFSIVRQSWAEVYSGESFPSNEYDTAQRTQFEPVRTAPKKNEW